MWTYWDICWMLYVWVNQKAQCTWDAHHTCPRCLWCPGRERENNVRACLSHTHQEGVQTQLEAEWEHPSFPPSLSSLCLSVCPCLIFSLPHSILNCYLRRNRVRREERHFRHGCCLWYRTRELNLAVLGQRWSGCPWFFKEKNKNRNRNQVC